MYIYFYYLAIQQSTIKCKNVERFFLFYIPCFFFKIEYFYESEYAYTNVKGFIMLTAIYLITISQN